MNKKQLLLQNEELNARLNEARQELQALHIRLSEAKLEQESRLAALERQTARCAELQAELDFLKAGLAAGIAGETAANTPAVPALKADMPADNTLTDNAQKGDAPRNNLSPAGEVPLSESAPQARIPAFSENGLDFESYFNEPAAPAEKGEKTEQKSTEALAAESLIENAAPKPKGQPADPEFADFQSIDPQSTESQDDDRHSTVLQPADSQSAAPQCNSLQSKAPAPGAMATRTPDEQQELQNYCARLIGRVALAATRVMVYNPTQNAANVKDLALSRSEAFKRQATAFLTQPGSGALLRRQLDALTADTEQFLNALANGLPTQNGQ